MNARRDLLQESLAAIERLKSRLETSERAKHEPIAIVGVGCRYPGGIEDAESLWRVVRDGRDMVAEVPKDRWDIDAYYDPDPQSPGKMVTRRGGFLSQVDQFDPQFFGISPREAETLDPQQRLLLETATEALESAGIATDRLVGSATGVFVGITTSDYGQLLRLGGPENSDVYSATGSALNAAAGRIAFTFGFQGPCVAVDTACSSSLVAVHLACSSLRNGESNLALAGGVNVVLSPDAMVLFSKWGMMAPDGACKTFDAAADGFVRAEGCAMIALKRLSDAVAAGDPVLAVIRGSAVNSDGRSSGLTVPNGPAQQAVLRKALADAMLRAADIDYVEAHGTGTPLGDPIEVEALGAVMREGRESERPLWIGSIKTNIGHTEAASGLAGLIKTVMALRHEAIPPHLHFSTPNPGIPWSQIPVRVPVALTPWPRSQRVRRAGVSSFGFSGTNAHIVLEEAPAIAEQPVVTAGAPVLVPLSARDDVALKALAARYSDWLGNHPDTSLAAFARSAGTGRAHLRCRLAVVADSVAQLQAGLHAYAGGTPDERLSSGTTRPGERPRIAFLFTGQGAQYRDMGRSLYDTEPVFRAVLDRATELLQPVLGRSLIDVMFAPEATSTPLGETAFTQPALFAFEYALAELWKSWGITPSVVLGHSVGEYVAACVAGVFTFEDGLALIAERGRLMQALPRGGAMAAIFADEQKVRTLLSGQSDKLAIAAVNGPEETVVSGEEAALAAMLERCTAIDLKSRRLDVSHAFHSPLLDPMLDALEERATAIPHSPPRIALISNLSGAAFAASSGPDARYWREHARQPVRFADSLRALAGAGATALVEIGPHPVLLGMAGRNAPDASWKLLPSMRRDRPARQEMLGALAALYAVGANPRWENMTEADGAPRLVLPTYPFQRERCWVREPARRARTLDAASHPLLGARHALAAMADTTIWENEISLESHPWLDDHRVQGVVIVPATAYIEMAFAAAREVLAPGSIRVRRIENLKPLLLRKGDIHAMQATLTLESDGSAQFAVHSRLIADSRGAVRNAQWVAHVTANVSPVAAPDAARTGVEILREARDRCTRELSGVAFYSALADKGNQWGPCFQGVKHLRTGAGEAVGEVHVAAGVANDVAHYLFHPAVSDACGHPLVSTVTMERSDDAVGGAFVGGGVGEVRFHRSPSSRTLWVHARLKQSPDGDDNVLVGDVHVYDEGGHLVSETLDARLWYLEKRPDHLQSEFADDWFLQLQWEQQDLVQDPARAPGEGLWLLLADKGGLAAQVAQQLAAGQGARSVLVYPGDEWSLQDDRATIRIAESEDYLRLLEAVGAPAVVLHCWSRDLVEQPVAGLPDAAVAAGPASVLHLLRALRAAGAKSRPRLWLVAGATQEIQTGEATDAPWSAMLWGLGKAMSVEHPELWGGLIDLPLAAVPAQSARLLIEEIRHASKEDKVGLRDGKRYVPRLVHGMEQAESRTAFAVRPGSTYLITGGLGGIGLAVARWLVQQGATHLLLVGRGGLTQRDQWPEVDASSLTGRRIAAVRELEESGAAVQIAALDISAEGSLESCLADREARGLPAVRGVFHAAGTVHFEALSSQDAESLRDGLVAKVHGAWRLHQLFAGQALDCFVLFSSSSALLSSPLLGGYAAGNSFLDALAHFRHGRGMPALSVNWGTWGEVGMAVEAGHSANGAMLSGLRTIATDQGLLALQKLLSAGAVHAAVIPADWPAFGRAYPAFASDPLLRELVGDAAGTAEVASGDFDIQALRRANPEQLVPLARDYLVAAAARVLGMAPEKLDPEMPLSSVGFDSLMAVQLKNRLESDFGVVVPMIQFLQGPSVMQLTGTLLDALDEPSGNSATAAAATEPVWEEGSL